MCHMSTRGCTLSYMDSIVSTNPMHPATHYVLDRPNLMLCNEYGVMYVLAYIYRKSPDVPSMWGSLTLAPIIL